MTVTERPPFWLRVRKEYIYDNFDEMADYLRRFPYDPMVPSSDYDETLQCLSDVVDDIGAVLRSTPLYRQPQLTECDLNKAIRIISVFLLASAKQGKTPHAALLALVNALIFTGSEAIDSVRNRLWAIVAGCVTGRKVVHYGIQWSDVLSEKDFHLALVIHHLSNLDMRPAAAGRQSAFAIESHGTALFSSDGHLELAAMNLAQLRQNATASLYDIDGTVRLLVDAKDARKRSLTFDTLLEDAKMTFGALEQVKPSPVTRLKDYTDDDFFAVRITHKFGIKFVAETVDSGYNRLEGKLLVSWDTPFRPDVSVIRDTLKVGDVIMVCRSNIEGYAFETGPALDDVYCNLVEDMADRTEGAVCVRHADDGSLWVSESGIRLYIHRSKVEALSNDDLDIYHDAVDDGTPLEIRYYNRPPDTSRPDFKVYAQPDIDVYGAPAPERFDASKADRNFVAIYLHESEDVAPVGRAAAAAPGVLGDAEAMTLAHILFCGCEQRDLAPLDRLEYLTATAVLTRICDAADTYLYIMTRIGNLERLVAFCHNAEVKAPEIPEALADVPVLKSDAGVIRRLAGYINPLRAASTAVSVPAAAVTDDERVDMLVRASNDLRGIIGQNELNNIKLAIARMLGIQDEFEPVTSDRTFYGSEGISLEFKKSIVFPPVNRRRLALEDSAPDIQRWAILKTVCGYLNSRSGGELLLGVNDGGYAEGVDADIAELYRRKMIASPDMDHYRLYVQYVIDRAFREYGAPTVSTDITALNVSYQPETNAEGKTILRITVRPYPYGVIAFSDQFARPDDYAESYVRRDGRTLPVTENLRLGIGRYKVENTATSAASRDIVLISKAIDERLIVTLRGYTSADGVADHKIEPYRIWKKRGLVYGWDHSTSAPGLFTVAAAESVTVSDRHYGALRCPVDVDIDVFGHILDKNNAFGVELRLTHYGRRVLLEEIPSASVDASRDGSADRPWTYQCRVSDPSGVGRFCLGLPDDVTIATGARVMEYVRDGARRLMEQ